MILDFNNSEVPQEWRCDIAIVGGGAAGITIAKSLIGAPLKLLLLEAGGYDVDDRSQDIYRGSIIGLPYWDLDFTRLRFWGGSTNHWGGLCVPLAPIDFIQRDWVPNSGWPITHEELLPYYARAAELTEIGEPRFDDSLWSSLGLSPIGFRADKVYTQFWRRSRPTNFAEQYGLELDQSENVDVVLHANVVNISANARADHVEFLEIMSLDGRKGRVYAKDYILATGGLENPRLLLASNRQAPAGLANANDTVGRFFMEHPHVSAGTVMGEATDELASIFDKHPLNPGLDSFYTAWRAVQDGRVPSDMDGKIWRILQHVDVVSQALYGKIVHGNFGRYLTLEELRTFNPQVMLSEQLQKKTRSLNVSATLWRTSDQQLDVFLRTEQAPTTDSRVYLTKDVDALGMPRLALDWRLGELERSSALVFMKALAAELGRLSLGRVRIHDWVLEADSGWPEDLEGGHHHMGTTRMSEDPKLGVVDPNCRAHEVDNLYLAGSSVFPTSGAANPTLSIVALALRLADHIKSRHSGSG